MSKGGFQEMDAVSLLTPHTKLAVRPTGVENIGDAIHNAYRTCWYGRPGTTFVDLPGDFIQGSAPAGFSLPSPASRIVHEPPKPAGDPAVVMKVAQLLRTAKAPLVVIGKGAAFARAELSIRRFIDTTRVPFLPTPMGKGVMPDSHPLNTASARSVALKNADVVLVLGARLNWILHFGEPPRWSKNVRIVQVDLHAEEIGKNAGDASVGITGDIGLVVDQLHTHLSNWHYQPPTSPANGPSNFPALLSASASKNEATARKKALQPTPPGNLLTYHRAFQIIKSTLTSLSPPENGEIVYVSEGANTMDISRSFFSLEHPRQRLDAGTYATMGVGLGYVVAAHAAYNLPSPTSTPQQKKIVAFEGDSAFGFSAMEVETLARHRIPALIFVVNNSGIYHGDTRTDEEWRALQDDTVANRTISDSQDKEKETKKKGLRSTSLLYETRYEHLAHMCGGKGYFVRTEKELEDATREGFAEKERVSVVNVIVDPGIGQSIQFGWQASKKDKGEAKL